ncbi:MAG: DUF1553 domain-containing protein [Opitutae bacterium]|nr:DUF1553 domain-containing protein [Opitutae bacterium]MBT5378609.1 DUF1553 domain-containing protein [Opitutae bacterium]
MIKHFVQRTNRLFLQVWAFWKPAFHYNQKQSGFCRDTNILFKGFSALVLVLFSFPFSLLASEHWSLQPLKDPVLPELSVDYNIRNPIDLFILKKLNSVNLRPAPEASREVLIRRVSFTLTGLPPSFDETQHFVNDSRPDYYERLVDRLLESPRYGEHWARYWLDLARYADTKGYVFQEDRAYPYAYTYRDWVIQAFNTDLSYDDFVRRQIAADLLPNLSKKNLAALGFLTVGNRFLNRNHLIIDDRIDVVGRGLMGMTVACARCHDHFFDPVSQKEYYSLYGVFASSDEPKELPVIGEVPDSPQYRQYLAEKKKREEDVKRFIHEKLEYIQSERGIKAYLEVVVEAAGKNDEQLGLLTNRRKLYEKLTNRWRRYLKSRSDQNDLIWGPWNSLMVIPEKDFQQKVGEVLSGLNESSHPLIRNALKKSSIESIGQVIAVYAKLFAEAYAVRDGRIAKKPALLGLVSNESFPPTLNLKSVESNFHRADRDKLLGIRNKVQSHIAKSKFAPPRAMVLIDRQKPVTQKVFLRGNPNSHGEIVARQFLNVLSGKQPQPFNEKGSGRLDLAEAIVSPQNPLTVRVIVNRVWKYHFGKGLVSTPSDFGRQGDLPSHPDLLDYLANQFINDGWSIKSLHRYILNSATFRQSSQSKFDISLVDPENRLLSRMNRQRLAFESMRDSMIYVSGQMNHRIGGHPIDLEKKPFTSRRAVYGKIVRQNMPALFRTFDVANPSIHTPMRPETTVPQQALFAMNSEFVQEQARQLAGHLKSSKTKARIEELYHRVLSRSPSIEELDLALEYLREFKDEQLAQVLIMSNEFMFVD